MKDNHGQVVLILILVMTVALAIGLSVIQRSLSDISTSTKIEESSRAFSAAEAGIEKVLSGDTPPVINFSENNSSATVTNYDIPSVQAGPNRQSPFECPPGDTSFAKEDVAQIWLADPNSSTNPPTEYYKPPSPNNWLDVYWGNSTVDKAALELTLVYWNAAALPQPKYDTLKWYLDHEMANRNTNNRFETVPCTGNISGLPGYQCQKTLSSLPSNLILLRARLLYNSTSQPFAVQAVGTCGQACSLPTQAKILISKGTSGQTRRIIQVCQTFKVVPSYFDYAIFSEDEIAK